MNTQTETTTAAQTTRDFQCPLRILSNYRAFDEIDDGVNVHHRYIEPHASCWSAWRIWRLSFRYEVILLDDTPPYLWLLCLLRWLWPFSSCRLVVVDLCLVKPETWNQRWKARVLRFLLKRVDLFIHYFKDIHGYTQYFGISEEKSVYVPFKVNEWDRLPPKTELEIDGDYVFTGGRSLRDVGTFLQAMRLVPYPGLLLYHDTALVNENGTILPLDNLPENVRAVEDDGGDQSWLDYLRNAKLVVIPTLPNSIRAIGVSSYLTAMALQKCVVMTDGPATRDVLQDEVILVPPGNPEALADAIRKTWEDDTLRRRTAVAGRNYAESVQGNERLMRDLLAICQRFIKHRQTSCDYSEPFSA